MQQHLSVSYPIFVACSGGRDSMALLFALSKMKLPIVALHVNHRLQTSSNAWEKLVKDFCQTHTIIYFSKQLAFRNPQNISEQQARHARYEALIDLIRNFYSHHDGSQRYPPPILALAHHANDQAETILMNLCQGTGLQGLVGMREWHIQTEFSLPLGLWRPLIALPREQISEYVAEHQLPYVDDPTNFGDDNQRAFLRQNILPQLAERYGGVIQNITRTGHNLAQASHILNEQAASQLTQCQVSTWTSALQCLDIGQLCSLSQEQRFYLLHFWLRQHRRFAPPRRFIETVNQLIISSNPDQQSILQWDNQQIRRYRNCLYLLDEAYLDLLTWAENSYPLHLLTNNPLLLATIRDYQFQLYFSQTKVESSFSIRSVQPGEKFQRLAHLHHQTFKNVCQTLAIPSWQRSLTFVVENAENSSPLALIVANNTMANQTIWLAGSEKFIEENRGFAFVLKFSQ